MPTKTEGTGPLPKNQQGGSKKDQNYSLCIGGKNATTSDQEEKDWWPKIKQQKKINYKVCLRM